MSQPNKLWYLEKFKFLNTTTRAELNAIYEHSFYRTIVKNQVIYYSEDLADKIYFLKKGSVKISRYAEDGREIILAILRPGDIFGELSVVDDHAERGEVAEATEDTLMCVMGASEIKEMIDKHPSFGISIYKLIGLRLKKIQSRYEWLCFNTVEKRIKMLILELAQEYGREIAGNNNEKEVNIKLTHAEIAKLTGTSRQTVTTIMNELERQDILLHDRTRIYIKNLNALK